ncbi:unnamed protein product, partial [Nesidiocoris tenuis]
QLVLVNVHGNGPCACASSASRLSAFGSVHHTRSFFKYLNKMPDPPLSVHLDPWRIILKISIMRKNRLKGLSISAQHSNIRRVCPFEKAAETRRICSVLPKMFHSKFGTPFLREASTNRRICGVICASFGAVRRFRRRFSTTLPHFGPDVSRETPKKNLRSLDVRAFTFRRIRNNSREIRVLAGILVGIPFRFFRGRSSNCGVPSKAPTTGCRE